MARIFADLWERDRETRRRLQEEKHLRAVAEAEYECAVTGASVH